MTSTTADFLLGLAKEIPAIIAALASIYAVRKVQNVHVAINSRFDQWMEATRKSSFAEGLLEGKNPKKA